MKWHRLRWVSHMSMVAQNRASENIAKKHPEVLVELTPSNFHITSELWGSLCRKCRWSSESFHSGKENHQDGFLQWNRGRSDSYSVPKNKGRTHRTSGRRSSGRSLQHAIRKERSAAIN
jgi:hypothetical protein